MAAQGVDGGGEGTDVAGGLLASASRLVFCTNWRFTLLRATPTSAMRPLRLLRGEGNGTAAGIEIGQGEHQLLVGWSAPRFPRPRGVQGRTDIATNPFNSARAASTRGSVPHPRLDLGETTEGGGDLVGQREDAAGPGGWCWQCRSTAAARAGIPWPRTQKPFDFSNGR